MKIVKIFLFVFFVGLLTGCANTNNNVGRDALGAPSFDTPTPSVTPAPSVDPPAISNQRDDYHRPLHGDTDIPAAPSVTPAVPPSPTPGGHGNPPLQQDISAVFNYNDLIDLADLNAGFIFDIKYATDDNFLGIPLYETPLCLAHTDLAEILLKAQEKAAEYNLRLVIYDVYRPMSAQKTMYELTPPDKRAYVAKPGASANHPKGVAVDCALADADGNLLPMPSAFDEFTKRASVTYSGGTAEETANRDLLINIMTEAGLKVAAGEWWHYSVVNSKDYSGLDISFDEFTEIRYTQSIP
ncbi:MAG: M15 family metallopeptidase [Oscillospiraceae bacterium]|nr:M15 family metallopeptidase [Oscillospiraceae bacterium]